MKSVILALSFAMLAPQAAEAGVIHRLGRIIRAPIFITGLAVMTVLDVTTTPVREAYYYYNSHPCVKW